MKKDLKISEFRESQKKEELIEIKKWNKKFQNNRMNLLCSLICFFISLFTINFPILLPIVVGAVAVIFIQQTVRSYNYMTFVTRQHYLMEDFYNDLSS